MASKRKLSNVVDDEEVKRRKIDEGGENNDEIELYKYHHFLPEHLKPDIKNEIVEYKHEIFTKLRQFYILLHSSTSPLTADQWQVLEHVLTLLRRSVVVGEQFLCCCLLCNLFNAYVPL